MARNREIRDDQGNLISIQDSEGNTVWQAGDWGTAGYGGSPQVMLDGQSWNRVGGGGSWGTGGHFAGQTFQGQPYSAFVRNDPTYGLLARTDAFKDAKRLNPTDIGNYLPGVIMAAASAGTGLAAGAGIGEGLTLGQSGSGLFDSFWQQVTGGPISESSVLGKEFTVPSTTSDSTMNFGGEMFSDPAGPLQGVSPPMSIPGIEGLSQAGVTSALGGAPAAITSFGPAAMALDSAGNIVNAGMNLANSAAPLAAGLGGAVSGAGGDVWSKLSTFLKAGGSILEWVQNKDNADELQKAMQAASQQADPFASQRGFYQDQLKQSYTDPNYFANSPVFAGMRDLAVNDSRRIAAGQGYNNSSNLFHDIADRVQKQGMNYATQFQGQTGQFAGAGINPGAAANIAAQGAQQNIQANQQTQGSLGNILQQIPNVFKAAQGVLT